MINALTDSFKILSLPSIYRQIPFYTTYLSNGRLIFLFTKFN